MDETQLAAAIAQGELASPQRFYNSWYFALRISGTRYAYRRALDEFVFREAEHYLTPEALSRLNGLPVIIQHPSTSMLNSTEYAERNIGSIVLPYVGRDGVIDPEGDESWGIARILDQDAAKFMQEHELSTSPAVIFPPDGGDNKSIELKDGKTLLIEGKPVLIDHVAICENGVWDKGGDPDGVKNDSAGTTNPQPGPGAGATEDKAMADEKTKEETEREEAEKKEREDAARRDADAGEKLDKLLSHIDSMTKRMDAYDKARKDAEEGEAAAAEAEEERQQAETLEKLAEEERGEAETAEEKADRQDAATRHALARKDGESHAAHSKRVHTMAGRHDAARFTRKDGEGAKEHSERVDSMCDEHLGAAKKDEESEEERKAAAEKEREDKAKKDAEEAEGKEKEEMEGKRDAEIEEIKAKHDAQAKELEDLKRKVEDRSDEDEAMFADAQARADDVFSAFGKHAPRPLSGENLVGYRIRLARALQPHSASLKDVDLGKIARADAQGFQHLEATVYADAAAAARNPVDLPDGQLREIVRTDRATGRRMIEFTGRSPRTWMQRFMPPTMAATRISRPSHEQR